MLTAVPESSVPLNGFPAGSAYGTLLHDLLEWQAKRGWPAPSPEWTALVARKAQRFNLDAEQLKTIERWIAATVDARLPLAPPFSLNSLGSTQAWAEMSFALPVGQLQASELDALITQHILPGQQRAALQPNQLEGMLIGFMDLVFEHEGRYYVLDYKSNRLPDYGAAALQQAILAHRYDVQMSLYLLALHRLLKGRLKDYDYDLHVGGALYLFMRGIDQIGPGLQWETPPKALILALDAACARPARRAA